MIELALRGTTRYWLWMLTLILLSLALRRITGDEAGEGPHPLTKPDVDSAPRLVPRMRVSPFHNRQEPNPDQLVDALRRAATISSRIRRSSALDTS